MRVFEGYFFTAVLEDVPGSMPELDLTKVVRTTVVLSWVRIPPSVKKMLGGFRKTFLAQKSNHLLSDQ